ARGYGRRRLPPTAHRVHAYAHCPHCATALSGGTVQRTREVIELVPGRAAVTAHVYVERRCPRCQGRWLPEPGLDGLVVGQGRLGVGLLSLIAVLREELRLPVARIQWYLEAVHGLVLSVGAIVAAGATLAARAAPLVARIHADMRASPVVHADETGWRQDGRNGYAWTFATPTARDRAGQPGAGRAGGGSRRRPRGVLVSEFYAAYTPTTGGTNTAGRTCFATSTNRLSSTAAGTATEMTLATSFGTWRIPALDPLDACRALLTKAQL
ncbi:MAG: IS66 family transposase, partial [Pseudonocardiaceae bacterium]